MIFDDRRDAGRRLAAALSSFASADPVVVGLPRGGVPVASEVADALGAPLDVILVRKLGLPFQPELAMGAIGEDGVRVLNDDVVRAAHVTPRELERVERRERAELDRRAVMYRGNAERVPLSGRTVIVVDDGIATGATARAACLVARAHGAARVVLAAPAGSPRTLDELAADVDAVVCLESADWFSAVGQFYRDFSATSDDEVIALLGRARRARALTAGSAGDDPPGRDEEVQITVDQGVVAGHLTIPEHVDGLVIFAHGSGSSRHSSRNRSVASVLNEAGFGTLLFDLLTPDEERDRANVFDIGLLAERLTTVTDWLRRQPEADALAIGYFGASTGAGAALWAAAEPDNPVAAVVSRGGRPDLAGPRLGAVRAPTLLIVGGHDDVVVDLNREAAAQLRCPNEVVIVPGATHLFEEPGTLATVAQLARTWFATHLVPATAAS